jgi:hypothetical protein
MDSQSLQLQLGSGMRCLYWRSSVFSMFYCLVIASLAWTTSFGCKIYLATLVSSAVYCMTWPKSAKKHMNTVGPPCCIAFVWLVFAQASRDKEHSIVIQSLSGHYIEWAILPQNLSECDEEWNCDTVLWYIWHKGNIQDQRKLATVCTETIVFLKGLCSLNQKGKVL